MEKKHLVGGIGLGYMWLLNNCPLMALVDAIGDQTML